MEEKYVSRKDPTDTSFSVFLADVTFDDVVHERQVSIGDWVTVAVPGEVHGGSYDIDNIAAKIGRIVSI